MYRSGLTSFIVFVAMSLAVRILLIGLNTMFVNVLMSFLLPSLRIRVCHAFLAARLLFKLFDDLLFLVRCILLCLLLRLAIVFPLSKSQ